MKLFMQQNGDTVAGKKVELIVKDDTGIADTTQPHRAGTDRQRQGRGARRLRPDAARAGRRRRSRPRPRCRQVVMAAATVDDHRGLALHRAHQLHPAAGHRCRWPTGPRKNGIKKVVTLVSDYGPGIDAEKAFTEHVHGGRRRRSRALRVPLAQPGLRALPAARGRRQARRALRLRAVRRRRAVHEAVRRARPRQDAASS